MASSVRSEDGSIEHVVHRLIRWSTSAPRGIAYVVYDSEDTRRIAEARWMEALNLERFDVETLDLWLYRDPEEAIAKLLSKIESTESTILSVNGLATLLDAMGEDWRALNYRREQWYGPNTRQVWWVPTRLDRAFRTYAPDLYAWFLVKESLTERVTGRPKAPPDKPLTSSSNRYENPESSSRYAEILIERFRRGLEYDAPLEDLIDLVPEVAKTLHSSGNGTSVLQPATALLEALETRTQGALIADALSGEHKNDRVLSSLVDAGIYFSSIAAFDLAERFLDCIRPNDIELLSPIQQANCLNALGRVALHRSDFDVAQSRFEEGVITSRYHESPQVEANCLIGLGETALMRSEYKAAHEYFEQSMSLLFRVNDNLGAAYSVGRMALIAHRCSDFELARSHYEKAIFLYANMQDAIGVANCTMGLGDLSMDRLELQAASTYYEEALELYRAAENPFGEASSIRGLAQVAYEEHNYPLARTRYEECLALYSRERRPLLVGHMAMTLSRLPNLRPRETQDFLHQAFEAWNSIGRMDLIQSCFSAPTEEGDMVAKSVF